MLKPHTSPFNGRHEAAQFYGVHVIMVPATKTTTGRILLTCGEPGAERVVGEWVEPAGGWGSGEVQDILGTIGRNFMLVFQISDGVQLALPQR